MGLLNKILGLGRETLKLKGEFTVEQIRGGKVIGRRKVKNLVVNAGKASAAALLGAIAAEPAFLYLAVGTGTVAPALTDTALGAEITTGGLARAASTNALVTTDVTNDTLQMIYQWLASAAHAVTEAGAFNASTAGDMLCRQTFAAINLIAADELKITYKIDVD